MDLRRADPPGPRGSPSTRTSLSAWAAHQDPDRHLADSRFGIFTIDHPPVRISLCSQTANIGYMVNSG
jgi:hypothetical protein